MAPPMGQPQMGPPPIPPEILELLKVLQALQIRSQVPPILQFPQYTQTREMPVKDANIFPPGTNVISPGNVFNNNQSDNSSNKILSSLQTVPAGAKLAVGNYGPW